MNTSILNGIVILFIFQFIGESITTLFSLIIPGPIVGMVLLLLFLLIIKRSFESLDSAAVWLLRYLALLVIPATAGIITQFDIISKEFWPIVLSLSIGTFVSLAFSMKIMDVLITKQGKDNEH
ncbi:CidA/LrgA family protein [Sulfurimonas sp.]|uniref:CidA/LrgA family protein n=1 Tax=Sulfurimonas sp. TaxID=2022749 RepID=UPI0025D7E509|nr:CidA/LrgA family protein [Sulfurimonas sp.]